VGSLTMKKTRLAVAIAAVSVFSVGAVAQSEKAPAKKRSNRLL
jgi:hypothetical protein